MWRCIRAAKHVGHTIAAVRTALALLSITGFLVRGLAANGAESPQLQAGAAEVDITPPIGFRMAGYFDERISTRIHDRLHAKAIVLSEGHQQLALVFCDLLGLSLHVTTNARAQASSKTGIPVDHIVISATHTHTGPLFDDVRRFYLHEAAVEKTGSDPHEKIDYPAFLTAKIVEAIITARAKLRPAELAAGIAHQEDLAFNRRYWMRNGKVAFNPGQLNPNIVRPAGPSDPDVDVLLVRDTSTHHPFAGITIFAMHSDTVGGTAFSADYEFYLQQTLRSAFGSNFISSFGAGTCGDINHINVAKKEPVSGFATAERLGTTLGRTVLDAVPSFTVLAEPNLDAVSRTIGVGFQEVTPAEIAEAHRLIDRLGDSSVDFLTRVKAVKTLDLEQRGSPLPMEVQVFRFDPDTALVCLPGEIFVELGLAIKHASPFKRTFVMSICNDRPSYVPTQKAFAEGSYEITNSRVQPGTGEQLVDTALTLLNQSKQP